MSVINQATNEEYSVANGDCVEVWRGLPDDSIGFTIFSPPFSQLYIYSDSNRDMGNAKDDDEFFQHYGYLVPELLRTTIPGRLCAVHCKDLPLYRGRDGASGLSDFPGKIIACHEKHGWTFHSRITIWKCPVTERERTNNNGLLHKTVMRDSSQIRQGMADYLLLFRKTPPDEESNLSTQPIARERGFDRYVGCPDLDPRKYLDHPATFARTGLRSIGEDDINDSIVLWRRYAEPVWWDIDQTDVLNFHMAKTEGDERHICPLALGLIRRSIYMWSNKGDIVASPFTGIGSEGYVAVQEGRKFVGAELKDTYWKYAVKHLDQAIAERDTPVLF